MPASPVSLPPRPPRWFWVLPRVAVLLSLVAVAGLMWVLHHNDLEEQRATLISDVLWLEQNLQFRLEHNLERLQQIGKDRLDGQNGPGQYELQAEQALEGGNGLSRLILLDAEGRTVAELPTRGGGPAPVLSTETLDLARQLGKAHYSPPITAAGSTPQVDVFIPLFRGGHYLGTIVGNYRLPELLAQLVPWWFAEKYRLVIADDQGVPLAAKSRISPEESGSPLSSYQVPFDPPGHGLTLQVTARQGNVRPLAGVLIGTILLLAMAIVWSLWLLRRHVQRRYAAEQALGEAHAFRKSMEDSLTVGMRARDMTGRIIYVNPAFCRMTGWSADELVGLLPPMPYWIPEELEATRAVHDGVLAGQAPQEGIELRLIRKSGERFDAHIFESPLIDAQGHQTGWMGTVLDVTQRKRAEDLYRQQQEKLQVTSRLVTMGEMASTLAHELNQPLSAIASYAAGCLNRVEAGNVTPAELKPPLAKLAAQAQRAGQIIRRIHDFVRRSEPRRSACDLNAIIEDAVGLLEATAKKRGVKIRMHLQDALPPLLADRVMVEQVALNLLRNGMDAMAETEPRQRRLLVATACEGQELRLSVTDAGSGISAAVAEKLFAPFFSTKADGMGMGLNICRSIAELHHGRLWFEPALPQGTVFHLTLPVELALEPT